MEWQDLPIYRHKEDIISALDTNNIIIVESPTGSGKTTQIPLILEEAGYTKRGIIGITQPRRIAAMSVSEFIKKQINDTSSYCGYTMRFNDTTTDETRIKIMTDGILLQEVKADPLLSKYSVIMVDEAHERSLNIDFILGLLKEISAERPELKIIISSATINTNVFSVFFNNAPILSIDSHPYPVKVNYYPLTLSKENEDYFVDICYLIEDIRKREDCGDILLFLPGEAEIKSVIEEMYCCGFDSLYEIYPLYGRLSKEEQEKVFTPTTKGKTKIVVSTNIAETSITIDGIKTVIDSGLSKVNFYNQKNFTSALIMTPISRASADQRRGRAGRTSPGVCYRLYSQENYNKRAEYSEEEIKHSDLAEVALRMRELGIYNFSSFPFITPPGKKALISAEETLLEIGAIDTNHHLTSIGEMMVSFPLLPRLSRVIVEAVMNYPDSLSSVLTAVAFLSTKPPFVLPQGEEFEARNAHHALLDNSYGDFVAWLKLYDKYTSLSSDKEKKTYCTNHYMDKETMDEIVHIKGQLEDILYFQGIPVSNKDSSLENYLICLASGLRQYICKKDKTYSYKTAFCSEILIHPGSSWFRTPPQYILAGEIVQTTKLYARSVSPLRKEWIERIDPALLDLLNSNGISKNGKKAIHDEGIEKYKTKVNNKNAYVVPFAELKNLTDRSSTKIYILIGDYISRREIKTNRIDNLLASLPKCKKVLSKRPNIYIDVNSNTGQIANALSYVLYPVRIGKKKEFAYLALRENEGSYTLVFAPSFIDALTESIYALSSLYDNLDESREVEKNFIEKLYNKLEQNLN